MTTLITSVYGDDELVDPPEQLSASFFNAVAVVDRVRPSTFWTQVIKPMPHLHPRLASKVAKYRPDLFTTARNVVWIDGSVRITSEYFVYEMVNYLSSAMNYIAMLSHPDRSSIGAEWPVTLTQERYRGQDVAGQAARYIDQMCGADNDLWVTAIIVRDYKDMWAKRQLDAIGNELMFEHVAGSYHDQLAMPYVLWKHELPITRIPLNFWHNPLFKMKNREVENP